MNGHEIICSVVTSDEQNGIRAARMLVHIRSCIVYLSIDDELRIRERQSLRADTS